MDSQHKDVRRLGRRQFLQLTGVSTAGLVLATQFGCAPGETVSTGFQPNLFVTISSDNKVTLVVARPEVGQGVRTSLPMILAEELDLDWTQVEVVTATVSAQQFGQQTAVNSRSVFLSWVPLRRAAATARFMLIQAAAQRWGVAPNRCQTDNGQVLHVDSDKRASYGELAARAQRQAIPMARMVPLKQPQDYRLLGTRVGSIDNEAIVRGDALFVADHQLPGQQFATFTTSPRVGGGVGPTNIADIQRLPGVRQAFVQPAGDSTAEGVAIVASNTFAAMKAQRQLQVQWQYANEEADSWLSFIDAARQKLADNGQRSNTTDDPATVDASYEYAFVAHVQLETVSRPGLGAARPCLDTRRIATTQPSCERGCRRPGQAGG